MESIEAAKLAVSRAASVCRAVQSRLEDVASILKSDKSPVTVADFASQAVVAWTLRDSLGSCVMVGEEDAHELREQISQGEPATAEQVLDAVRTVWSDASMEAVLDAIDLGNADPEANAAYWTLDPIDGTKGYLRNQQYAVALAWIEAGRPTLGVLGCPNLSTDQSFPLGEKPAEGTIYAAAASSGTYELPDSVPASSGTPIRRSPRTEAEPVRMCESAESGHTSRDDSAAVVERLGQAGEPARLDSQAKYAVVARGQADLYLRLPRPGKRYVERIWDHAAGSLVAAEAGCTVTDVLGNPLDFAHGAGLERNIGVVVGEPGVHARAAAVLGEIGVGRG